MRVLGAPREIMPWLCERAGCALTSEARAIVAITDHGAIAGMVGYDLWTENSVWMHIALASPAALRSLIVPGFEYPFVHGKKNVALVMVRSTNSRSYDLCQRLGFREGYRVKDGIRAGEDMVFMEMRKAECRWLGQKMRKAA